MSGHVERTAAVLAEVAAECDRQIVKWGEQHHPDGTGKAYQKRMAETAKATTDRAATEQRVTWRHILDEEVLESYAESEAQRLRTELIQSAAVAVSWVRDIDSRAVEAAA